MKILVIEAVGLHIGYLGCYGNEWVATPNLDRLAANGVVFDWHYADRPELGFETPWHERSVVTGRYCLPGQPPVSNVGGPTPRVMRCARLVGFADEVLGQLRAEDCWLWIEGPSLVPPWRLDEELLGVYFDEDDDAEGLTPWRDPPLAAVTLGDADTLRLQNTYAAAVTFFDAQLGKLLERLPGDETLICVTARAGFPLGEHGAIGLARPSVHEELVHVPLVMRFPAGERSGMRIPALTQPLDLPPTFLEFLGQPRPSMNGSSLLPLIRGEADEVRPFALSMVRAGTDETWLMRTLDRALHVCRPPSDEPPQLFVKPDDRWEVNNLYQHEAERADAMQATLTAFAAELGAASQH